MQKDIQGRRVLLDENVPIGIVEQLPHCIVTSTQEEEWAGVSNGNLLRAAKNSRYDIFVTGDKKLPRENNLEEIGLAIVLLSTTHWPTIQAHPELIGPAIEQAAPGKCTEVTYPQRPQQRYPGPPSDDLG
jgi:hypothetical protein